MLDSCGRFACPIALVLVVACSANLSDCTVTHHVEASVLPSWIGTERVRRFRFRGDTLILETLPVPDDPLITTLRWVRAR